MTYVFDGCLSVALKRLANAYFAVPAKISHRTPSSVVFFEVRKICKAIDNRFYHGHDNYQGHDN